MTCHAFSMARILLVPGFWLGAWAWDEVADELRRHGEDVLAMTLPGLDPQDDDRLDATLERQAQAIVDAVAPGERAVLVSHSGGGAAAYLATDLAPERFARAIYVDSAPLPNGFVLNSELDLTAREYPLPEWRDLEGAGNSLAGLDEAALSTFRARAVSEPTAVAAAPLQLSDEPAGRRIPTTVICNTFTAEVVRKLRDEGEMPMFAELSRLDAEYVDLPTGHWPMWSKPRELAELIHTIVQN
ncbi:alpha/beta hydrolase [Nocardia cyriacigeorgica]|uniref:Alpha/beta hydrolase n=2 Tax=Nocardia cyriacigeorgica TaxID=135487 RepID=A0A6P1D4W9_9NOCA|nr:alpha/beta hydrolase [Nocardia cyriacigeorgica]NEW44130.1 alpha/beta hydrolase [Nocardia cyriacigeorgica]NEW52327.1 alpha/beta hydrolase [Nocardia cyriacigeorgica]